MHIDRPLDSQSFDVRNPQRMHLHMQFGHHSCATGQVHPRLRHFSPLSDVNDY